MRNGPKALIAILVAAIAIAGIGIIAAMRNDGEGSTVIVGGQDDGPGADDDRASTSSTSGATTTTAPPTPPPPTTAAAPPATTAPRPTTTAPPRAPSFDMTPTSGPAGTRITASGGGCQGESYGVGIRIHDPSGQPVDGDGGATQPDGTWRLEFHMGNYSGPGKYTIRAMCMNGAGATVFDYAPQTFTVT